MKLFNRFWHGFCLKFNFFFLESCSAWKTEQSPSKISSNRPVLFLTGEITGRLTTISDGLMSGDYSVFHAEQYSEKKNTNFKQEPSQKRLKSFAYLDDKIIFSDVIMTSSGARILGIH